MKWGITMWHIKRIAAGLLVSLLSLGLCSGGALAAGIPAGQSIGTLTGDWSWESRHSQVQSDTMNLIHEAQLWAAEADVSVALPLADGSFCMRQLMGEQRAAELTGGVCYAIYPNEKDRLLAMEMTGQELKDWLEESANRYTVEEDGTVSGGSDGVQAYGLSYTVCLGNPEGDRIKSVTYEGKPVTTTQTFRVAVSESALAALGRDISSYPSVWEAAGTEKFRAVGGSVTLIVGEYIRSLSTGYRLITPPEVRSRWSVTAADSGEALGSVTRLEFVERLYDTVGRPSAYLDLKQTFADIGGENPAAAWATQAGIVRGDGSGLFKPEVPISREQAAIMLLRFDLARDRGPTGSWAVAVPYADATEISAWASEAVMWNVIRGYLLEDDGGNFRPQADLTALELDRILKNLGS